jgi:hypothetical protein
MLVLLRADLDAAGFEPGLVEADLEPFDDPRLDILGAAAGTGFGKIAAEIADAAEPLPLAAVPAISTADLAACLEADQGRHDFDLEPM